jgi:apolipoprotein N-acyltransferase
MHEPPRYIGFGLATVSGCLWFLACTPFDLWLLGWVAAVPMLWAVDRARTLKGALFLGAWAGAVETAGGFYWLIDTVQRFTGFPWIAGVLVLILFCATRAVIFLVFTAIVRYMRRRREVPMAVLAPLGLVIGEFLVPQLFPCGQWITQAWHPLVIQIAELTGPLGVTALLMLVNGALYDLWSKHPAARAAAAGAAAMLAAALIFGTIRMHQIDVLVAHAPHLKVGLVQPNFAYTADGDFSPEEAVRQLTALQEQSRRMEREGAELVVWSEGSYPVALPRTLAEDLPADSPGMIRRNFTVPVLVGTNMVAEDSGDAFNTAVLLDARGRVAGRYDKVRLLAFGEYVPGMTVFPWLGNLLPAGPGRFTPGTGPKIISLDVPGQAAWRLGPLICYEDLLPDYIRSVGAVHPDLLVNLTSDQWFGARTEPFEHLALSVFSTVELRTALVRAVNSGISAMIDPNGRLLEHTYADDPYRDPRPSDSMLVSAPKLAGGYTLYVAWGPWFPAAAILITAAIGYAVRRRR